MPLRRHPAGRVSGLHRRRNPSASGYFCRVVQSLARLLHCPTGQIYSAPPMPKIKMKTKSGVKKRFSLTAKGRIKRKHAYLRHILTPKRTKNKRKLRRGGYIAKTQEHQIKAMIPYGL